MGWNLPPRGLERPAVLLALSGATALSVALEVMREAIYGLDYRFLIWNLTLAWMPLALSLVVHDSYRRGVRIGLLTPLLGLWLLFLPNAPYLVTDLVHLRDPLDAPRWYDALLLACSGATGVLLGFTSLYLVQTVLRHRFGYRAAWVIVSAALALTGLGVFVGRVLRWNSWDMLTQPVRRAEQVLPHLANEGALSRALLLVALVTGGLGLGYALFYQLVEARRALRRRRGRG